MRLSTVSTILILALSGLPYLVDVAYCEDLQRSLVWQEVLLASEECDPSEVNGQDLLRDLPSFLASFAIATDGPQPLGFLTSAQWSWSLPGPHCSCLTPRAPPAP